MHTASIVIASIHPAMRASLSRWGTTYGVYIDDTTCVHVSKPPFSLSRKSNVQWACPFGFGDLGVEFSVQRAAAIWQDRDLLHQKAAEITVSG